MAPSLDEKLLLAEECARHLRHVEALASTWEEMGDGGLWRGALKGAADGTPARQWSEFVLAYEIWARAIDDEMALCASLEAAGDVAEMTGDLPAETREQAEVAAQMLRELTWHPGADLATLDENGLAWRRRLASSLAGPATSSRERRHGASAVA